MIVIGYSYSVKCGSSSINILIILTSFIGYVLS